MSEDLEKVTFGGILSLLPFQWLEFDGSGKPLKRFGSKRSLLNLFQGNFSLSTRSCSRAWTQGKIKEKVRNKNKGEYSNEKTKDQSHKS